MDFVSKNIEDLEVISLKKVQCISTYELIIFQIPRQPNGYDCGVYVTQYAELFYNAWPSSTSDDINKRFEDYFHAKLFEHNDIDAKRVIMRSLLDQYVI